MSYTDDYSYRLELFSVEGRAVGQAPAELNWDTAVESARFGAIRKGLLPASGGPFAATVTPRWNAELGKPYTNGFRVGVSANGSETSAHDFNLVYFGDVAARAAEQLVSEGKLRAGETYRYSLAAFPVERSAPRTAPDDDAASPTPLRLLEGTVADRLIDAEPRGPLDATDMPLFVPRRIEQEISALATRAGARETGGVLVGNLYRDASIPDLYAVVEAQIPATQARGMLASLTFNPETWAEIHQVLALRGRDETMLGWWHSHPSYEWNCKNCPVERRRKCPLAGNFFSEQDRALHRTVFPSGYSVALVVNLITVEEHTYSLFGWRDGLLQSRGFHRLSR